MNRWALRHTAIVTLVCLLVSSPAQAEKTSADVVKATATADKPDADGKQTVTITIAIDKPWHLYANPVQLKEWEDNATVVEVSAGAKLAKMDIVYPEGAIYKDGKDNYRVYEDSVTIKATIVRAKGDTSPLSVFIKVNACKPKACLLPGEIRLPVQ